MTTLVFPWPDSKLSPNSRVDRRWVTPLRRRAKSEGFILAQAAGLEFPQDADLEIEIVIHPPDKRKRDDDNIYSAFKSYRDGVFQYLDLDDSAIRRTVLEWGEVIKGGELHVTISEL